MRPYIPEATVRQDDDEVTFAVTFKWGRPWAMDHCEVGCISGELRRAILKHFAKFPQLAALVAVETWEPSEERHIGKYTRPIPIGTVEASEPWGGYQSTVSASDSAYGAPEVR